MIEPPFVMLRSNGTLRSLWMLEMMGAVHCQIFYTHLDSLFHTFGIEGGIQHGGSCGATYLSESTPQWLQQLFPGTFSFSIAESLGWKTPVRLKLLFWYLFFQAVMCFSDASILFRVFGRYQDQNCAHSWLKETDVLSSQSHGWKVTDFVTSSLAHQSTSSVPLPSCYFHDEDLSV